MAVPRALPRSGGEVDSRRAPLLLLSRRKIIRRRNRRNSRMCAGSFLFFFVTDTSSSSPPFRSPGSPFFGLDLTRRGNSMQGLKRRNVETCGLERIGKGKILGDENCL